MNDLNITLRYMTAADHKRYGLERSDPSDTSAGWFVEARQNEAYECVRPLTRVSLSQAVAIASTFDCFPGAAVVKRAVEAQNRQHDQDRVRRRAFLENQLVETQRELDRIAGENR